METTVKVRKLYQELKEGARVKLGANKKVLVLKYIDAELKRLSELHENIVSHNPQMKDYRIENIPEYNHLIRVKQFIKPDTIIKKQTEDYKSLTRARAFCIMEMLNNKKIEKVMFESKKEIVKTVENEFPGQSGRTVYESLRTEGIYFDFETQKGKHKLDYEYGIKLYKLKYPDC
jgi:hypothetical protein